MQTHDHDTNIASATFDCDGIPAQRDISAPTTRGSMEETDKQLATAGTKRAAPNAERRLTLEILRMKRVIEITGKSRSSIYEAIAAGTFPPKVRIGVRSIGFYSTHVSEYLADPMGYRAPGAM